MPRHSAITANGRFINMSLRAFAYLIYAVNNNGKITVIGNYDKYNNLIDMFKKMKEIGLVNFDEINGGVIDRTEKGILYQIVMKNFSVNKYRIVNIGYRDISLVLDEPRPLGRG